MLYGISLHTLSPTFHQLVTAGDCAWLKRRKSAFATVTLRTFPPLDSNLPGMLVAYRHIGHKSMNGEIPFQVNVNASVLSFMYSNWPDLQKGSAFHGISIGIFQSNGGPWVGGSVSRNEGQWIRDHVHHNGWRCIFSEERWGKAGPGQPYRLHDYKMVNRPLRAFSK